MRHLVNAHSVTSPAGSIYRTSFSGIRSGPVAATGKAVVHWNVLTYKNLIYLLYLQFCDQQTQSSN